MKEKQLTQIYREESRNLTATLIKIFGFSYFEEIEDAVQETFLSAFEVWKLKGLPENPKAWLYAVAKNKILSKIQKIKNREKILEKNLNIFPKEFHLEAVWEKEIQSIDDNTLQVLFAISHPSLPVDSQIALALKTSFGFTVKEIAELQMMEEETIQKKLYRARQTIQNQSLSMAFPPRQELEERRASVLKIIYLVFTQGHYGHSKKGILQIDLMREALRLSLLLSQNQTLKSYDVDALVALFAFHSSRLESRVAETPYLLAIDHQDRTKWNQELIQFGNIYLTKSLEASRRLQTDYQVEAMIAMMHTREDNKEKWEILSDLNEQLFRLTENKTVFLNQVYSVFRSKGRIDALALLSTQNNIPESVYFHLLLAYIWKQENRDLANSHLESAQRLAKTQEERETILFNWNLSP
ncbi:putative RNA polymerase sigma factor containing a TPR repeat domain [Leptospira ryugenii]|uniref:Putative RNA polymerase sigma factor containing a TPR repeat domain n=1 Tax=Leptospira ryugenii TaxID=1917863 RepID=A0A2P2E0E5_9LEPT|nr:sigma-70 family RNA polymerase sigma factor [Leptospira ryugenii]GBF50350.1 putative RNA polymerase sigma factor containing a TPR repeat domain [Leptospira ryugenii]